MDAIYKGGQKSRDLRAIARAQQKPVKVKVGATGTVLKFAEQAQKKAQIHKTPEKSVFQIISRRYQLVTSRGLIDLGDGL